MHPLYKERILKNKIPTLIGILFFIDAKDFKEYLLIFFKIK